ncbi:MAG TPA: hypothetical protein VJ579_02140 [Candidatus Paceibacterota bacterium]|nr:hypothetical protein [Candidatus Paceibacterota bacterium]
MEILRTTKISTSVGTLLIVLSAIPLVAYTFYFRTEKAKLQNGVDTSPQFIVTTR